MKRVFVLIFFVHHWCFSLSAVETHNINTPKNNIIPAKYFWFIFIEEEILWNFVDWERRTMELFLVTFILIIIVSFLFYFYFFNTDESSSIPYAKHGHYPIVGHLFSFLRDRTKLLIECSERYGTCFKIRLLNQRFILVLSRDATVTVHRSPVHRTTDGTVHRSHRSTGAPVVRCHRYWDSPVHRWPVDRWSPFHQLIRKTVLYCYLF